MKKSWQLDRRSVLKGAGVTLALPLFESMVRRADAAESQQPKRICSVMFPYGIAVPKDDDPERDWGWFPRGEGNDYQLTNVLEPLEPLMDHVSIFGGL